MKAGDEFPAVVVAGPDPSALLGGLHRAASARGVGQINTDAYRVLSNDPVIWDKLRRILNVPEGHPYTKEESILQAIALANKDGLPLNQAAEIMGLSYSDLTGRLRANEARLQLAKLGLRGQALNDLKMTPLLDLHTILPRRAALRVAELVPFLTADERRQVVVAVRETADDEAANEIISQWEAQIQERKTRKGNTNGRAPVTPEDRLVGHLHRLDLFIEHFRPDPARMPPEMRKGLVGSCKHIAARLVAIANKL
jgi:hypothetical protein